MLLDTRSARRRPGRGARARFLDSFLFVHVQLVHRSSERSRGRLSLPSISCARARARLFFFFALSLFLSEGLVTDLRLRVIFLARRNEKHFFFNWKMFRRANVCWVTGRIFRRCGKSFDDVPVLSGWWTVWRVLLVSGKHYLCAGIQICWCFFISKFYSSPVVRR